MRTLSFHPNFYGIDVSISSPSPKRISGNEKGSDGNVGRVTKPSTTKFWLKLKNPAIATNNPKKAISFDEGLYGATKRAT
mmetsp:Transcript_21595/g.44959  ORF Transcript_21595/g.44959 Transcript_21595/m.44959 type:complete len:80 (+) Transcript_21595:212-451(+)